MIFHSTLLLTLLSGLLLATGSAHAGDRDALVGTWKIVRFEDDARDRLDRLGAGPATKKKPARTAHLVITAEGCRVIRGDGTTESRAGLANAAWTQITCDASTTPKSCDITGRSGKDGTQERVYLGIYDVKGNTLRICWCEQGKTRPENLESDGANNLFVCERVTETKSDE